jgi:hypothetical protein
MDTLRLSLEGPGGTASLVLDRCATLEDLRRAIPARRLLASGHADGAEGGLSGDCDRDPLAEFLISEGPGYQPCPEPEPEMEVSAHGLPPAFVLVRVESGAALVASSPGLESFTPLDALGVRDGSRLLVRPQTPERVDPASRKMTPQRVARLAAQSAAPSMRVQAAAPAVAVSTGTGVGTAVAAPCSVPSSSSAVVLEPDWRAVLAEDGRAAMVQKLCAYKIAHTPKVPGDAKLRVAAGAKAVSELVTAMTQAGVTQGDESTRSHLERFCGHVQTTYFDGVTTEEHGAELRNRCKQLNAMIESLCRLQKFKA